MKFCLLDHAGKGAYLRQRLTEAGHEAADRIEDTDLLILDCDWRWAHPRPAMIEAAAKAGVRIALYPHGGMPTVFVYDGLSEPDPRVDLRLEHGPGHIEVARLFGADALNQHAAGWLYSPTAPFTPLDEPGRVLFAPMHPNIEALQKQTNGHDPAPAINQRIFRELLDTGAEFDVSVVELAHRNGVWPHPRARVAENHGMSFQQSYELVRQASCVVATGTMAALAVALGKPTVMFQQGDASDYIDGKYQEAAHAALYRDVTRYPLDCEDGHVMELLARACAGHEGAAEWRAQFVGDDGAEAAIRLLENLISEPLSEQAKSRGATEEAVMREEPNPEPEGDEPEGEGKPQEKQQNVTIQGVTARAGASATT